MTRGDRRRAHVPVIRVPGVGWMRERRRAAARASVLVALCLALPLVGRAQSGAWLVARADTLLIAGRIFAAESLYYDAVRRAPRDPAARLALGRYLAERGALRVGAVLMEEARYFGGDPATVAEQLAPVYERLGKYRALAALPGASLPYAERLRAEWLRDNPPSISGPDSGTVTYEVTDSRLLGRVALCIGNDTVMATIDAKVEGLVLDSSWMHRKGIRTFASRRERDARRVAGVADSVQLGAYTLTSVVASFLPMRAHRNALIGLDLLGKLAPTFDPAAGRIRLRRSGKLAEGATGWRIATLTNAEGVWVVKGETIFPIGHPDVQQYLRKSRWTLNPWRGEIIVDQTGSTS